MNTNFGLTRTGCWTTAVVCVALSYGIALVSLPSSAISGSDDQGRAVFVAKGCANCHAVYGRAVGTTDPSGGPDLGKRMVYNTRLGLAADLWNHLPTMLGRMERQGVAPPSFTAEEVEQVIRYLSFIRYMDEPGNANTGRRLLDRKKCTRCHGLGGREDKVGPDLTARTTYLSPLDLATALWNHGREMNELFEQEAIERPRFSGHDVIDLAAGLRSYIRTNLVPPGAFEPGDPAVGSVLSDAKGCTQCHAVRGVGGNLAPDFTDMDLDRSVTEIAGDMWNHGPEMWEVMRDRSISFPVLDRSEMADLIAYLYSLGLEDAPGDGARGERLVSEKRCVSCHSIAGSGGELAGDLAEFDEFDSPASMVAAMWSHAADMARHGRDRRARWPTLTGTDLCDIYAFIRERSTGPSGD